MMKVLRFTGSLDGEVRILTSADFGLGVGEDEGGFVYTWVSGREGQDVEVEDDAIADKILAADRRIKVAPEVEPEALQEGQGSPDDGNEANDGKGDSEDQEDPQDAD